MAAFPYQLSGSRRFSNELQAETQSLPTGSCNFRDLNLGARAPTCGCTQFWLNRQYHNGHDINAERAWCFCGHHACFHSASIQHRTGIREKLSDAAKASSTHGGQRPDVEGQIYLQQSPAPRSARMTGLGIGAGSQHQSQSVNTRLWEALNAFARDQDDGQMSDTTSKLPSTAAPSIAGEVLPSLGHVLQPRGSMGLPVSIPTVEPANMAVDDYSATEMATPSVDDTPNTRALSAPLPHAPILLSNTGDPPRSSHQSHNLIGQQSSEAKSPPALTRNAQLRRPRASYDMGSMQSMQATLRAYGQRLEALEGLSFSQISTEEVQDRLELFDGRMLDLEQWRMEHERVNNSPDFRPGDRSKRHQMLGTESSSFASSDGSFDSNAAIHTEALVLATLAANAETGPRIDALERRIEDLENVSLPSFVRPWHVQVVLLPWGPGLRGIWFSSADSTEQSMRFNTQESDEWAGVREAPKLSFKSTTSAAWTTESIEAWANQAQDWLSPKACGPTGTVFQRLASRGLVQEVTLTASDSRHICDTIRDAFEGVLPSAEAIQGQQGIQDQGLRERFIPLRKVRKSSRLRFLSPAEMITSACWTAGFLDSSVVMRVNEGQRRLYMTTPEAYLQSAETDWSWRRIRQLPLHGASGEEQAAYMSNIAIEACWSYNDRLDRPPSEANSFVSRQSQWSSRSQASSHPPTETARSAIACLPDPQATRPVHYRSLSLPSANTGESATSKRRIASFEEAGTSHLLFDSEVAAPAAAKRQRTTPSPELERRARGLTPRWSREPPSPFASEYAGEAHSKAAPSRRRGATPLAYATPHSNSTFVGRTAFINVDGDTDADTDILVPDSERIEDEWNGVDESTDAAMLDSGRVDALGDDMSAVNDEGNEDDEGN